MFLARVGRTQPLQIRVENKLTKTKVFSHPTIDA
jgi:hypothetical protein